MSEHPVTSSGPHGIEPMPRAVTDFQRTALLVGGISFVLLLLSMMWEPQEAFRSLLFAFVYWLSISMGALGFVMISHMTGGGWGVIMRRFGESAALNLPLMLLVFLVLAFGFGYLFPWAHIEAYADQVEVYNVLKHREILYKPSAFFLRTIVYFAIWIGFAMAVRSGSLRLDHADNPRLRRTLRKISAGGMVLFFVTTLGFAMDYFMSRETNWFSSILGFITDVGMGLAGMSFVSLSVCYFADKKPLKDYISPQHLNDLGNIMLALVILWMYTSFAQFLIQWNGTLQEDVGYYTHRGLGSAIFGWRHLWRAVALLLLLGHFFLPFFLLLMKGLKRKTSTLARICCLILFMRILENLWLVAPSGQHRDSDLSGIYWTDIVAWLGVGGIWMFNYLRILGSKPMLPKNASHQPELVIHGAHGTHTQSV
jgi:hypothetical protein